MDHQEAKKRQEHLQAIQREDRFVKISEREDRCDLNVDAWASLCKNQFLQTWKGVVLQTGVTELGIFPMLLNELKPKTIIELGTYSGGNALWLADHMEIFGIESRVYSIDIDPSLIDDRVKDDPRISFLTGDCFQIEKTFTLELLASLPHPWLIIDDAHVNLSGVLDFFHNNGLQAGDYIVVEDTNPLMWEYWINERGWSAKEEVEGGPYDLINGLREWLLKHETQYLIDTHYQDMYGYNVTKHWNAFIKCVSPQQR